MGELLKIFACSVTDRAEEGEEEGKDNDNDDDNNDNIEGGE